MGACHMQLYKGTYPGVGALHSPCQNSYLGAYPGLDVYTGQDREKSCMINFMQGST